MKKLAVAAVAVALIAAAPRGAAAQGPSTAGAVVATVLGAAAGGAVGYYYVTGSAATVIGAVIGGFVGDWWYTAGMSRDVALPSGKTKMFYTEGVPPLELIGYANRAGAGLRTAAFSAASD